MFDIGFWELALIGVVALLVIGPERLPGVARTVGLWVGRISRFVSDIKVDIDKELKADELRKVLQQQANTSGLHEMVDEGRSALAELDRLGGDLKQGVDQAAVHATNVSSVATQSHVSIENKPL